MILLDTDHLSVLADGRHSRHASLVERLLAAAEELAIPVVAVEEQLRAWLAQLRRARDARELIRPYDRLIRLIELLADWKIARWNESAAQVYSQLRKSRIRLGTQDMKIGSIALAHDALLLSANLRDFRLIPDLRVEDWLRG